jgi:hypothetical protein
MKNILTLVIAIVCVGLIGFGLWQRTQPTPVKTAQTAAELAQTDDKSQSTTSALNADEAVQRASEPLVNAGQTAIPQQMKKYYPDGSSTGGSAESSQTTAEQGFQITPSLLVKMYLVDKYKPGICFGLPTAPPQSAIDEMMRSNDLLAKFLREKYNLTTDLDVYNKIKQLQGIFLTEISSGSFNFRFTDGQCQTIKLYEGTASVSGTTVTETITSQEDHTY